MCLWSKTYTSELNPVRERILKSGQMERNCVITHSHSSPLKKWKTSSNQAQLQQTGYHNGAGRQAGHARSQRSGTPRHSAFPRMRLERTGPVGSTHPTLKTSASFRNAELMRMGNGYFWKSLGKRTTASHCSPSLPDLRPTGDSRNHRTAPAPSSAARPAQSATKRSPHPSPAAQGDDNAEPARAHPCPAP